MVYKGKENKLQATLYWKPTDQRSYLQAKSASVLKRSIAYIQTLRLKTICSIDD